MKKTILALGLIAGALGATSAVAQDWRSNGYNNGHGYQQQYDRGDYRGDSRSYERGYRNVCSGYRANRLETRIAAEARSGDIDWRTARYLRSMVDQTQDLQRRYCSYGVNDQRARDLDHRYDQIERRLRWEDNDNDGWRR